MRPLMAGLMTVPAEDEETAVHAFPVGPEDEVELEEVVELVEFVPPPLMVPPPVTVPLVEVVPLTEVPFMAVVFPSVSCLFQVGYYISSLIVNACHVKLSDLKTPI